MMPMEIIEDLVRRVEALEAAQAPAKETKPAKKKAAKKKDSDGGPFDDA